LLVAPGALRLGRRLVPFVIATSLLDLAGYAAFLRGAQEGIAITAVVTSQYAVVAVVGGFLVYRERLTRLQATGVLVTLAGVAALAAVQS
jgi:drug/metabolite transporter (DMT)-like permease